MQLCFEAMAVLGYLILFDLAFVYFIEKIPNARTIPSNELASKPFFRTHRHFCMQDVTEKNKSLLFVCHLEWKQKEEKPNLTRIGQISKTKPNKKKRTTR